MSEQTPPELARCPYPVSAWFESLPRFEDPDGVRVLPPIRWEVDTVDVAITYLFRRPAYATHVEVSGTVPEYLREDDFDAGVGIWRLTAPCVVVASHLDRNQRVVLRVIAVSNRRMARRARRLLEGLDAGLMRAVTKLPHCSKRQQRSGEIPDSTPPNHRPEGRDPNG